MHNTAASLFIREATSTDIPGIHLFQQQWEQEGITHGFVSDDTAGIQAKLGPYFLVAMVDGELAGFISGEMGVSDGLAIVGAGERYLEIADLYVAPAMRGMGIGGALVERLLEVARQKGLRKALVYTSTKDIHRMLAFYEDHGFGSWYVRMYRDL